MFIRFVMGWLTTLFGFYQLTELPSLTLGLIWSGLLLIYVVGLFLFYSPSSQTIQTHNTHSFTCPSWWFQPRVSSVLLGLIIGGAWGFWHAFFAVSWPNDLYQVPVQIQGTVEGLAESRNQGNQSVLRFTLQVDSIHELDGDNQQTVSHAFYKWSAPRIQLNWYQPLNEKESVQGLPMPGQAWQGWVKLKPNHGAMNPGALDYEAWLYQQRIHAKGYVLNRPDYINQFLEPRTFSLLTYRATLSQQLTEVLAGFELSGLYRALMLGDRRQIKDAQWQVLQQTGTIHLMAISGLHMAIVALLAYLLAKLIWWFGAYRIEAWSLPGMKVGLVLVFTSFYLLLSGAAIPTQRAYLMVLVVVLFWALRRTFQPWTALAMAAFLITLWDERALLSHGFWLSFLAVAVIFAVMKHPRFQSWNRWQQFLAIQVALSLVLFPYVAMAFQTIPIYGWLANLLAVPFVTFFGLPVLLVTAFLASFSATWAHTWLSWVDPLWMGLWSVLQSMTTWPQWNMGLGANSLEWMIALYLLLAVWVLRKHSLSWAVVGFMMGTVLISVLSSPQWERPEFGQARVTLLDVGQGQALVVETALHVMVVDTGSKWGESMDGSKLAILPFLKHQQWSEVDYLMVSHSDIDHAGGTKRLLDHIPVGYVSSGQPVKLAENLSQNRTEGGRQQKGIVMEEIHACYAGETWQWDGVLFEVFSPSQAESEGGGLPRKLSDNDLSCVLKVTAGAESILIPGDIGFKVEKAVLEQEADNLKSTILVAGHHGSASSTSSPWLEAVRPQQVWISAGFANRYGFPKKSMLQRLSADTRVFNTACSGALQTILGRDKIRQPQLMHVYQQRLAEQKWYHHRCSP